MLALSLRRFRSRNRRRSRTQFTGFADHHVSEASYLDDRLGINVWQSQGTGTRNNAETGLAWFSLAVADDAVLADCKQRVAKAGVSREVTTSGFAVADPRGTQVRLIKANRALSTD